MISHQPCARISKSIIALTFLTLFYAATFGQSVKLTTGALLESKDFKENGLRYKDFINNRGRASASSAFFTSDNEAHIGFGVDGKDSYYYIVLQNYLNLKNIREVSTEEKGEASVILKSVVKIKDKNFMLYTQRNKANKETLVYVNELSDKDVLLGNPIKLFAISDESMKSYGDIHVRTSENKKSLLIYQASTRSSDYIYRAPKPTIVCHVMDENFGKMWQGDLNWSSMGKGSDLRDVEIDDDGNIYALLYKGNDKTQRASVFSYSWKKQKTVETALGNQSEEAKTYGCRLAIVEGKDAVVAGLSLVNEQLFYFATLIDPNASGRELIMKAFSETDHSLMAKDFISEKGLGVQHITRTGNTDYIFSIEENSIASSPGSNPTAFYYSGRIYLVSVGSKGENWNKLINKRQSIAANPFLSSHALIRHEGNVFIFYNDVGTNFRSEKIDDSKEGLYSGANTVVVMQKINPAGEMISEPVPTGQSGSFGINPGYFIKIREGLYHTQLSATTFTKFACAYATIELK